MPMSNVYSQMLNFIEQLPIPSFTSKTEKLSDEQAGVMKSCFEFIHKNFLDFETKSEGKQALLNLLQ